MAVAEKEKGTLDEKKLLRELVSKVEGMNNARAKFILKHQSVRPRLEKEGFKDSEQFFKHLNENVDKFSLKTSKILKDHFERQDNQEEQAFQRQMGQTHTQERLQSETGTTKSKANSGAMPFSLNKPLKVILGKERDWASIIFIVFSIGIMIYDKLEPVYQGFDFNFTEIATSNWLAVIFSGAFTVFILWRIFTKVKAKDPTFLLIIFVLTVINFAFKRYNFGVFEFGPLLNFGVLAVIVVLLFGVGTIRRRLEEEWYNDVMYLLMALTITYFWINWEWMDNTKALIHAGFILVYAFMYIKPHEDNPNSVYLYTSALLFFDFYAYSLSSQAQILEYFPFLTLFVIGYAWVKGKSGFAGLTFTIMIIIAMFLSSLFTFEIAEGQATFKEASGGKSLSQFWADLKKSVTKTLESRIEYAITGKVEKNKAEPLGVYLENVKASDPSFFDDESVTVWGTVKARTLDDPVKLNVSCYVKKSDTQKIFGTITSKSLREGKEIFTFEEDDFECRFAKGALEAGTHTVTVATSFNFETESYLKSYFIEDERRRSMARENLDVLDQFGIKDKKPVSVFTNGPIALAIGTKTPPTGIDRDEKDIDVSWVGVNLDHNKNWQGSIDDIKELVIFVPRGFYIDSKQSCNREFELYTQDRCERSCDDIYKESADSRKGDSINTCKENCKFLFGTQSGNAEEQFDGYALNVEKVREEIKSHGEDIKENERFRSFRCVLLARDPNLILGNTPISTKYFRSRARYTYTVEKKISVNVKKVEKKVALPTSVPGGYIFDSSIYQSHNFQGGISWRINPQTGLLEADTNRDGTFEVMEPQTEHMDCARRVISSDYYSNIQQHSKDFSVPVSLVIATICTESSADPTLSRDEQNINDASRGLMQILHSTAKSIGYNGVPEGLFDKNTNIFYGTKYISSQKTLTSFDPPKAAAAYNAGSLRIAPPGTKNNDGKEVGNIWYMRSTQGHIDRFVRNFNAAVKSLADSSTTVQPAKISDLSATSVEASRASLSWTAPGNKGSAKSVKYVIRYSENEIASIGQFYNSKELPRGNSIPSVSQQGTKQTLEVTGLEAGKTFYFAIVVEYLDNTISGLSNSPFVTIKSTLVEDRVCCKGVANEFVCEWKQGSGCLITGPCPSGDINYKYCEDEVIFT